ncbi:hypothetical protein IMSAGC006_01439 [Muribaculaceae bacterium]|nr:hypothetical protein IMSAGC006_01439 [Muribaculaceae bacterium]
MSGGESQGGAAFDYGFPESDRYLSYSVGRLFVAYRIVIERAPDSGERREIKSGMLDAYDFLYDDSHFFLVDHIGRSGHVGF